MPHVVLFYFYSKGGHFACLGLVKGEVEVKTNVVVKKQKTNKTKSFPPQPSKVSNVRCKNFDAQKCFTWF